MSENIMNQFGVGQDEFIFRMYSIALIAITAAAIAKGDMKEGLIFMLQPGTYAEQQSNMPIEERSWNSVSKISIMIVSATCLPGVIVLVDLWLTDNLITDCRSRSSSVPWVSLGRLAQLQLQRILAR